MLLEWYLEMVERNMKVKDIFCFTRSIETLITHNFTLMITVNFDSIFFVWKKKKLHISTKMNRMSSSSEWLFSYQLWHWKSIMWIYKLLVVQSVEKRECVNQSTCTLVYPDEKKFFACANVGCSLKNSEWHTKI